MKPSKNRSLTSSNNIASPNKKEINRFSKVALRLVLCICILIVIIVLVLMLLKGKETITGEYPNNYTTETLICSSTSKKYKKITAVKPDKTNLELTMIFSSATGLRSIFLSYTMEFADKTTLTFAENRAHAEMDIDLGEMGFHSGKFDKKFSIIDNKLILNLFATPDELDAQTIRYFALNDEEETTSKSSFTLPQTLSEYESAYKRAGFSCHSTSN